ncbi:hypothetical protein [Kocuria sp. KH4]
MTKKQTTLTALQMIGVLNAGYRRGTGYPFSDADNALRLVEKLGLSWPSAVHEAFAAALDARAVLDRINPTGRITFDMLSATDAEQQVRDVMIGRLLDDGVHRITAEVNMAVTDHLAPVLIEAAPYVLDQLRAYAAEHVDDRRFDGVTGSLPDDLAHRVHMWRDIAELHRALITLATGEGKFYETQPVPYWSWCYLYQWEPAAFLEFLDLYGDQEREDKLHEYAQRRGMVPDLASTGAELTARARPLAAAVEAREKAQQEEAEQQQLTRQRPLAHVGATFGGTTDSRAAQVMSAYGSSVGI